MSGPHGRPVSVATAGLATSATPSAPAPPRRRYAVLDFSRLMAVFLMIQGHAMGTFLTASAMATASPAWAAYMWLRGLTASTFFLISGVVNFVSLERDEQGRVLSRVVRRRVRRGVALIAIDYLLIFPARRIWDVYFLTHDQWFSFFRVGTLNLIGMSLLLLTGLMAITRSNRSFATASLAIGGAIAVSTPFIHQVDWFGIVPAYVAHYLTLAGGSTFAVFPHAAFMFLGAGIGPLVHRWLRDPRPSALTVGLVGAGLVVGLAARGLRPFGEAWFPTNDYWDASPFLTFAKAGFSLAVIGVYSLLFEWTSKAAGVYTLVSRKVIHIYVIHILLIFGCTWFLPPTWLFHGSLGLMNGAWLTLVVVAVSYGTGLTLAWLDERRPRAYARLRLAGVALIGYLVLVGN